MNRVFDSVLKGIPVCTGFYFTLLGDWSRKLVPPYQPIISKTKANRDLVTCVFPRFNKLPVFTLSSHWLMMTSTFFLIGSRKDFTF